MKEFILKNKYDIFLIGLSILTYMSYVGLLGQLLMPIFIVIAITAVFLRLDIFYLIPLGVFMQMSNGGLRDDVKTTTIYIIMFTIILAFDAFYNRKINKLGKLFFPLLGLVVASIITGINAPTAYIWFAGLIQLVAVLAIYFYFVNTTQNPKEDLMLKAAKMFLYASVIITLEMIFVISQHDLAPLEVISRRKIDLGWENINVVIFTNLMAIPLITNIVLKSKYKAYYLVLANIAGTGILLTLSRSSVLTLIVFLSFMVPYMFYKSKKRVNLLLQGIGALLVLGIFVIVLEQNGTISGYFDALFGRELLAFDDRYKLLVIAWDTFKSNWLIGSGGIYASRHYLLEDGAKNYHNIIAQVSTLGVVGFAALSWLFIEKVKLIFSKKNTWKRVVVVLVFVTAFVNGWVQPMYFYITYLIYLVMILAVYENSES